MMLIDISPKKVKTLQSIIYLIEALISNNQLRITEHPKYLDQLEILKAIIHKMLDVKKEEILFSADHRQLYAREHILSDGNTYEFVWDISRLEQLIKTNGNKVVRKKFKIGEVEQYVDYTGLENRRLSHALKNQNPIFVIDYSAAQLSLMVDGNHRVAARYRAFQDKEMLIQGVYIPADVHIKALASSHQKTIFKVLTNINRIYGYLAGLANEERKKKPKIFNMDAYL